MKGGETRGGTQLEQEVGSDGWDRVFSLALLCVQQENKQIF